MKNFEDIFKKSFLASYTSANVTVLHVAGVLLITALIAAYIFVIYRLITKKTFYSKNFNISLAAISVITAAIILAVQSSIVISLGMVGALSIVRFRTAIKDPMDLCFLFWSLAVGICCGAHATQIALILSLVLTILVFVLEKLPVGRAPMILVVNLKVSELEIPLMDKVKEFCRYYQVKSRNISAQKCNLIIEVRTGEEYKLLQAVQEMEGVESSSLVSHDGEVTF